MDDATKEELNLLTRDAYDLCVDGQLYSTKTLLKIVAKYNNILKKLHGGNSVTDLVNEWVERSKGSFFTREMNSELGFTSRSDKKAADMALRRLAEKQIIIPCGEKRGCWKPISIDLTPLNWKDVNLGQTIPVKWPLNLEKYFRIFPSNVVVVAGEKNAGKTGFLLNLVYLNHALNIPVNYFSSEMAEQELAERVALFPNPDQFDRIKFFPLDADTITEIARPNEINIFDYLEIEDEFWSVARKIRKIWQKIEKGVAVIAIQKDPDARYGRGKGFSTEKSRVYLTMTKRQVMTLEEIKNWHGSRNPNGLTIPYLFKDNAVLQVRPTAPKQQRPLAAVKKFPSKGGGSNGSSDAPPEAGGGREAVEGSLPGDGEDTGTIRHSSGLPPVPENI